MASSVAAVSPEGGRLVVDVGVAGPVRRAVGPIAWYVIEALGFSAPPGEAIVEMECSARRVSAQLGVSKDSAARALRRLAEVGIVERTDYRNPRSGRFEKSIYVVDLAAAGLLAVSVSSPPDDSPPSQPHERSDSQLSFLS